MPRLDHTASADNGLTREARCAQKLALYVDPACDISHNSLIKRLDVQLNNVHNVFCNTDCASTHSHPEKQKRNDVLFNFCDFITCCILLLMTEKENVMVDGPKFPFIYKSCNQICKNAVAGAGTV